LRKYGGTGKLKDGRRIGRLLRNITFSGKGYVDKPANPDSIIFKNTASLTNPGVNNNVEGKINMEKDISTENPNQEDLKMIETLKAELLAKSAEIAKLNEQITNVQKELAEEKKVKDETISKAAEKATELETKVTASAQEVEKLTQELASIKEAELKNKRIAVLLGKGLDEAKANEFVSTLANMDDSQFDFVVANVVVKADEAEAKKCKQAEEDAECKKKADEEAEAKKCKESKMTDEEKKQMEDDCQAAQAEKLLEEAKASAQLDLSKAADKVDETKVETVREQMTKAFASRMNKKTKSNKEN
jgi:hypothetical protein